MPRRSLPSLLLTFLLIGCQQSGTSTGSWLTPSAPSPLGGQATADAASAQSVERPNRGHFVLNVDHVQYAPPGTRSTFDGRCSVPSLFIEFGKGTGEMTHGGRSEVTWSHCTRTTAAHEITFRDGTMTMVTANGDVLTFSYGIGSVTPVNGVVAIDAPFAITGGTGRFEGASGAGTLHGEAPGRPQDLLAGMPFEAEMTGTIRYAPGRGGQ